MADAIRDCQLTDMKARGAFYTWNNKQGSDSLIYSRIDRVFINEEWLEQYPDSFAHFLPRDLFDHCPGAVHFEEERQRRGNSFKYYNMWSMANDYKEVVIAGWNREVQGTPMFKIVSKLKGLKKGLLALNKDNFEDIENLTKLTELSLKHFQSLLVSDPYNKEWIENERACAHELTDMVKARDQFLKQKAKCDWMKYGDENTAFFHAAIKKRRARNRVFQVLVSHTEHYAILNAEIIGDEVRDAMFAIPGNKALGSMVTDSQFLKDNWPIGDRGSIELLLQAFKYFSKASGLVMNSGKSNFYTNGVPVSLIQELEQITGMKRNAVPFRYLGVLVSLNALSVMDQNRLVDNVVEKLEPWGPGNCLIFGRVVLIQSVLTVIDAIEKICRQYLWYGKDPKEHPALWVQQKNRSPRVRWVHAVYIKSAQWMDYEPHSGASWAWRKICQVKNKLKSLLLTGEPYTIQKGYDFLKPLTDKVTWIDQVVLKPMVLVQRMKQDVRARLKMIELKCKNRTVIEWVNEL
ncbi:uncharacterized protein LOC141613496 [Silene latifolia]|uniref:uncharacterized protein LOC141613496 n=1 Tax=Silene latifolia TaxID=37657 RepID=UPI003D778540